MEVIYGGLAGVSFPEESGGAVADTGTYSFDWPEPRPMVVSVTPAALVGLESPEPEVRAVEVGVREVSIYVPPQNVYVTGWATNLGNVTARGSTTGRSLSVQVPDWYGGGEPRPQDSDAYSLRLAWVDHADEQGTIVRLTPRRDQVAFALPRVVGFELQAQALSAVAVWRIMTQVYEPTELSIAEPKSEDWRQA